MSNGMVAGFYHMWLSTRDSNGYPKGQNSTPDSVTNKTLYTPLKVRHPVSYTPATPTREVAQRRGGQAMRGQRSMGVSSYGAGTIVLDAYDEVLHALVSRSAVDTTTVTGWSMTSQNAGEPDPPSLIIGMSIGFSNISGAKEFLTGIFHSAQLPPAMPGASQDGGVNPNPLTYEIVVDSAARTGMGLLFSATALNVEENTDTFTLIRYSDPIFVTTWIADGTETTFTLPYLPLTSDATGGATNLISKDGVKTAVTSVNTTSGVVTLTAPGTAGDIWIVAYPTRYVVSPP